MTTLAVLEEIQKELSAVSEADMRRAERTLGAQRDGEKPLGTIHNIEARRLWALANLFEARGMQEALRGKYSCDSDEEVADATRLALRFGAIEKLARELFWLQAKEDIGGEAWTSDGGIGLRSGWMLVSIPKPQVPEVLTRLIGL